MSICCVSIVLHSLIRGVLIQSCSAGDRNFTKYVFFQVQFGGLVQNYCAISMVLETMLLVLKKPIFYFIKLISLVIICIDNKGQNGTINFNILDNTTEFLDDKIHNW